MTQVERILVRTPNWIGDQILAYPFFYHLRKDFPAAHIEVLCAPWVEAIQFRSLVNGVTILPKPENSGLLARFQALEASAGDLRQRGPWDLGICLPNSFSSAWILYRAGVRMRRGYNADGRGLLLNQSIRWDDRNVIHRAEAYLKLIGTDQSIASEDQRLEVLRSFNPEKDWPEKEGSDAEVLTPPSEPYWVLAPGSTAESRRWSIENVIQLAQKVYQETKLQGIIIGGVAEAGVADTLASDSSLHLLDWTARGSVASYWRVFREAKFSVCNDSGLAHVASLCGSPVQVIWGAGNPKRTAPLGPGKVQLTFNPVDCWPCERNVCDQPPTNQLICLRGIRPETVWEEIRSGFKPNEQ